MLKNCPWLSFHVLQLLFYLIPYNQRSWARVDKEAKNYVSYREHASSQEEFTELEGRTWILTFILQELANSSQVSDKFPNLFQQRFEVNSIFDTCESDQVGNYQFLTKDQTLCRYVRITENAYAARDGTIHSTERVAMQPHWTPASVLTGWLTTGICCNGVKIELLAAQIIIFVLFNITVWDTCKCICKQ